ncbi:MAG: nitroreductase family protein [Caldicoprobacterales bacterium]|jgi:nitroreductase|nr:NAD(P)H nitroreductase [Clostridiales bacterium]
MLLDLLKQRRSIRKYEDKAVEKEKLDVILKSALLSPSSRGIRPWEFVVVTDKKVLEKLSQCKAHGSQFLKDAPLGIVVIADTQASDVWIEDVSIASTIIQLSAQSLGLGSCWIQVRNRKTSDNQSSEDYIRQFLNIPEKYSVDNIIAIGYPAEEKKPYSEDSLLYDKIHMGKF